MQRHQPYTDMADNYLERQREDYEKDKQAKARKRAAEWKKRLAAYAAAQKADNKDSDKS